MSISVKFGEKNIPSRNYPYIGIHDNCLLVYFVRPKFGMSFNHTNEAFNTNITEWDEPRFDVCNTDIIISNQGKSN